MNFEKSDIYKKYVAKQKEKRKSIKSGNDVVHISYYKNILSEKDLSGFENQLGDVSLRLSSYNQSGDINNSFQDFILHIYLALSQVTINEIISNTISDISLSTIKSILMEVWNRCRGKFLKIHTSSSSKEIPLKFGIKINIDQNTKFNFHMSGELDESTVLESLDKAFNFLKTLKKNPKYKLDDYVIYDEKKKKWKKIDVEKQIKKSVKRKKK